MKMHLEHAASGKEKTRIDWERVMHVKGEREARKLWAEKSL